MDKRLTEFKRKNHIYSGESSLEKITSPQYRPGYPSQGDEMVRTYAIKLGIYSEECDLETIIKRNERVFGTSTGGKQKTLTSTKPVYKNMK